MSPNRTRAFTLIELLVVVAIIGILIAILVPALGKVRGRANTTRCLSTIRGLGTATQFYLGEWHEMFPLTFQQPNGAWNQFLRSSSSSYGLTLKTRICPEAMTSNEIVRDPGSGTGWFGTSRNAWGNSLDTGTDPETGRPLIASYGLNAYVYNPSAPNAAFGIPIASMLSLPAKVEDAKIPVFVDCTWRHLTPQASDNPPANLFDPGVYSFTYPMPLSYAMINRHNKAVNVAFSDGHAETVPLLGLYNLKWSRGWIYRSSLPKLPAN